MKRTIGSLILFLFFFLNGLFGQTISTNQPFTFGEELNFEVSYGWINLADARLQVSRKTHTKKDRPHYKIDVFGKTKGAATIFGRVNDNWGTYFDVETNLPSSSYRHIEEGKYRKHETVFFDQKKNIATVELYDKDNRNLTETKIFELPGEVQDLVSGFYYLRLLNLDNISKGDAVVLRGFFDKKTYNIKLIYEGNETLDTKVGTKETYVFSPQLPDNKLFRGDHPIKIWITKDENKIPVKIKAALFIGSLNFDITSVKGLQND
jgi:hypothetical protein